MEDLFNRVLEYWKANPTIACASLADAKQKMIYAVAGVWGMPRCDTVSSDEVNANENTSVFWDAYLASLPHPEPVADPQIGEDN